jgi:hypothetical protein
LSIRESNLSSLRYRSADKSIAIVSSKRMILARGKGTCYVYAYAHNGVSKQVKVTVK